MRTVLALVALAVFLAPAAYAVGQARDPRVPGLQRKVVTLQRQVAALQADAAEFSANYVKQDIDQRVLGLCRGLAATADTFSATERASEPAFGFFLGAVLQEGSTALACPS
jgi:hypothetical protein